MMLHIYVDMLRVAARRPYSAPQNPPRKAYGEIKRK